MEGGVLAVVAYHLSVLAQYANVDWIKKEGQSAVALAPGTHIQGVAPLEDAQPDQLAFFEQGPHTPLTFLQQTQAGAVIVSPEHVSDCPTHALVSIAPKATYAKLAQRFFVTLPRRTGVDPTAVVGKHCHIADSAYVGPHCVLGDRVQLGPHVVIQAGSVLGEAVTVGEGTYLWPRVTVYQGVQMGMRCVLHSGAVVGADGFGWVKDTPMPSVAAGLGSAVLRAQVGSVPRWIKVPQLGGVQMGDDVEVGANTTIDRGAMRDTVIGSGVKIDNLVHIAHNVCIGAGTLIAACVGIAGSTTIGSGCMIAGGVGISDHVSIPDGTVIMGMSTVSKSIKAAGQYSSFLPAQPHSKWSRAMVRIRQLDALFARFKRLEEKVE